MPIETIEASLSLVRRSMPWTSSQSRRKGAPPPSYLNLGEFRVVPSAGNEDLEMSQCRGAEETKAESDTEESEKEANQSQPAEALPASAAANDSNFASRSPSSERMETTTDSTKSSSRDWEAGVVLAPRVLPAWADKVPQGITRNLPTLLAIASMFNPTTEAASSAPYLFGGLSLAAAAEGLKYYGEAHATQAQVNQAKDIHEKEFQQAFEMHKRELKQAFEFHEQELKQAEDIHKKEFVQTQRLHFRETEQHLEDITSQIRESQKEADRDLWEQQNTEKQNIMTVAALFMAGAFALAVEGQLPANTGNLMILPFIAVVDAYYFMLAFCISMLFACIIAGMSTVRRMALFMLSRTSKQQETLRELRHMAYLQHHKLEQSLKKIDEKADDEMSTETEVNKFKAAENALKESRGMFSSKLWQQPVTVMDWNNVGEGRFVVNFVEWYHFDKVRWLATFNVWFFNMGAVALLLSLGIYTEAHLRQDENEVEETSSQAAILFWSVLAGAAFVTVLIEGTNMWFPAPHWRDDIIKRTLNVSKELSTNSEDLCSQRHLNDLLHRRRRKCHLLSVNVLDMERIFKDLFNDIDVDKSLSIEFREVCNCLGFMPKPVPVRSEDGSRLKRHPLAPEIPSTPTLIRQQSVAKEESAKKVRALLHQHSILQEAVLKLVEKLILKEESFQTLYKTNARDAFNYLDNVLARTRQALHDIEIGVDPRRKVSWWHLQSEEKEWDCGKATGISKEEWKKISADIFRELFF